MSASTASLGLQSRQKRPGSRPDRQLRANTDLDGLGCRGVGGRSKCSADPGPDAGGLCPPRPQPPQLHQQQETQARDLGDP